VCAEEGVVAVHGVAMTMPALADVANKRARKCIRCGDAKVTMQKYWMYLRSNDAVCANLPDAILKSLMFFTPILKGKMWLPGFV
jgi:hypothetical protein